MPIHLLFSSFVPEWASKLQRVEHHVWMRNGYCFVINDFYGLHEVHHYMGTFHIVPIDKNKYMLRSMKYVVDTYVGRYQLESWNDVIKLVASADPSNGHQIDIRVPFSCTCDGGYGRIKYGAVETVDPYGKEWSEVCDLLHGNSIMKTFVFSIGWKTITDINEEIKKFIIPICTFDPFNKY